MPAVPGNVGPNYRPSAALWCDCTASPGSKLPRQLTGRELAEGTRWFMENNILKAPGHEANI